MFSSSVSPIIYIIYLHGRILKSASEDVHGNASTEIQTATDTVYARELSTTIEQDFDLLS